MLRDITIGQYFPGKSVIHRMDPRMKLILSIAYIVMLFCVGNEAGFLIPVIFLIAATVSYTHLDVYKRQAMNTLRFR